MGLWPSRHRQLDMTRPLDFKCFHCAEPVYGAYSSWPLLSGGIRQFSSISRGSSSLTSRHSSESCADQ